MNPTTILDGETALSADPGPTQNDFTSHTDPDVARLGRSVQTERRISELFSISHGWSRDLYPLRFEPLFRRYIWGGHRLNEFLAKKTGNESAAESWEVVDHQADQSIVQFGDLAGRSLRQLITESGTDLLGEKLMKRISSPELPIQLQNRFPLLLKFLDANRHLSVQVHPDDAFGATLNPPDLGKTEAWFVMHAEPGSKIFAGLKPGVTEELFRLAVANGDIESTLHHFEPQQGDCIFIPAGTMHAIGAGLLIAEIQQASNTTFRVYDWGRVDQDGLPRPLHIEQAITATDFRRGPVVPVNPIPTDDPNWATMVACEKFVMNRGHFEELQKLDSDGRFRILAVTKGSVELGGDPSGRPLEKGETALVPASLGAVELKPGPQGVEMLDIFIPD